MRKLSAFLEDGWKKAACELHLQVCQIYIQKQCYHSLFTKCQPLKNAQTTPQKLTDIWSPKIKKLLDAHLH